MEIDFARIVKDLGRVSSEELSAIFSRSTRSDYDKKECIEMLVELTRGLGGLNVYPYEKIGVKSKAKTRSTKKEIVRGVIMTMREMLKKYESTDEVDEWNIYFTIGTNYRDAELEDIKAHHTRLVFHFIYHA